ncbi:helix-turn-helix transcriptional regulator [Ruegeria sp. R13_0]|uniref:helix-turn-helix domain-containing protein n=1 Tax=Ruegeria sp. R13_0 TaxID=2821099 RepID=UPI001ADBDFC0|nr:AraC family transcriptional regulator [Ruegeria sp. R13_0]MBO9436674.1 helix-turn-helix transcriptional regulator [Ruegeria sp. R13_0]
MDDLLVRLDLVLRGGAVTALAICAVIFLADRTQWPRSLSVPTLCVGLGAYLLVSTPSIGLSGTSPAVILVMMAGVVPILAVWAGAELFFDQPDYRPWHGVVATLVAASAWFAPAHLFVATVRGVLVVLLYMGLLYIALSTAADDLVESRRRFRRWFVALMALTGLGISLVELLRLDADLPPVVYPLHASVFLLLTILFLNWATRITDDLWPRQPAIKARLAADLSSADAAVLQRIEAAMAKDIWKQEGLSIAQLAASVDAPEHRVRRAINKGLGYRNFAQFVNERRVEAARAILSDPERADTPILSIAYDVGFASLGPFNRAFRERYGKSPSEYRSTQEPSKV